MHPINYAIVAAVIIGLGALFSRIYFRKMGLTRLNLARLDFVSYGTASAGILCMLPLSARFFSINLSDKHADIIFKLSNLKYMAAFLIALSVGFGLARRYYTIQIEK